MSYQKPVTFRCPSMGCRSVLSVPAARRGQQVCCPYCKRVIVVPRAAPVPATPPEEQPTPGPNEKAPAETGA